MRDGFVIRSHETDEEIHFMPCAKNGRMRDRVEDGLLMKVDFERYYFEDTREAAHETVHDTTQSKS